MTAALAGLLSLTASPIWAQTAPPVSLGAGMQTSFVHTSPKGGDDTDAFVLNSARFYVNGPVSGTKIKFMFNTEYNGSTNNIGVLDAVARIEVNPQFNIWMGRFLPPSDRANLYGPYYSHEWAVYTDGIQDGYPFASVGRDNGVAYWGQFGKVKLSAGAFDGATTTGNSDVLTAARVQVDLWDAEDGYYQNATYYGAKNLLAFGGAIQAQSGNTASSFDFLLERKTKDGGAVSIESEYANYDKLGGYDSRYAKSSGAYVLASYLVGKPAGPGKIEFLGKYAKADFKSSNNIFFPNYDQKTTEINVNYVVKEFNARVMFFFKNTTFSAVRTDFKQFGVGLQIQM